MISVNLLGVQLNSNQNVRVKVDIDSYEKVNSLKNDAAEKLNCKKCDIILAYCGNILDDKESISTYGIKHGVTVHVLKSKQKQSVVEPKKMSEVDIQQLSTAFKTFKLSPNYRTALQRLSRPEVLQNIIASTPGLSEDLVALAITQDTELLVQLTDIQVLRKIIEVHPSLAEVASHIAASIHEEASNVNPDAPGPSTGYSYSLEALSDDDMDSSSSDGPLTGQSALANSSLNNASNLPSSLTSGGIITAEMFSNAMQQALGNVNEPQTASSDSQEESIESITRRLTPQLNQMRELGLTDLVANIQALQATGGDVQAAIELVFSGVISPST